jgi:FAD synthetase
MVTKAQKELLVAVYSLGLLGSHSLADAAGRIGRGRGETTEIARKLKKEGLLDTKGRRLFLTEKGRSTIRVVMIGGGFEVVHLGHLHTIEEAKALGDALVVSVARDSTIRRRKGREPLASEAQRVRLLSSLRQVDAAVLGVEGDIYETMQKVSPDVVALGYDQHHQEEEILAQARKRGIKLRAVRLDSPVPLLKTSKLPDDA